MALTYTETLEGLTQNTDKEGHRRVERRVYEGGTFDEVLAILPNTYTPHPTVFGAVLLNKTTNLLEGKQAVEVLLTYGPKDSSNDKPEQNQFGEVWEWMQVSQMINITQSPEVVKFWQNWFPEEPAKGAVAEGNFPDRLIRVNGEGKVEGVEVYRGTGALRVSKEYEDLGDVNAGFRQGLYLAQARTNQAAWFDWGIDEILFLGANIRKSASTATVDFNFLFGSTENLEVKILSADYSTDALDAIMIQNVKPFEYIWTETGTKSVRAQGAGTPVTSKKSGPICVKKTEVYKKLDFNAFGLGGPD